MLLGISPEFILNRAATKARQQRKGGGVEPNDRFRFYEVGRSHDTLKWEHLIACRPISLPPIRMEGRNHNLERSSKRQNGFGRLCFSGKFLAHFHSPEGSESEARQIEDSKRTY